MSKKEVKTNAMRMLDRAKVSYSYEEYVVNEEHITSEEYVLNDGIDSNDFNDSNYNQDSNITNDYNENSSNNDYNGNNYNNDNDHYYDSDNSNTGTLVYIAAGNRYYHKTANCKFISGAVVQQVYLEDHQDKFECNCWKY